MCRVGRARRKKYEARGKKRGGAARTDEVRKWDEGTRGEVEGNGDSHCRGFSQNQTDRPLGRTHKEKLQQEGGKK